MLSLDLQRVLLSLNCILINAIRVIFHEKSQANRLAFLMESDVLEIPLCGISIMSIISKIAFVLRGEPRATPTSGWPGFPSRENKTAAHGFPYAAQFTSILLIYSIKC